MPFGKIPKQSFSAIELLKPWRRARTPFCGTTERLAGVLDMLSRLLFRELSADSERRKNLPKLLFKSSPVRKAVMVMNPSYLRFQIKLR